MLAPGASLATARNKSRNGYAYRNAGATAVAVGTIGKDAAAPESDAHEFTVDIGVDEVRGRRNLRASQTTF